MLLGSTDISVIKPCLPADERHAPCPRVCVSVSPTRVTSWDGLETSCAHCHQVVVRCHLCSMCCCNRSLLLCPCCLVAAVGVCILGGCPGQEYTSTTNRALTTGLHLGHGVPCGISPARSTGCQVLPCNMSLVACVYFSLCHVPVVPERTQKTTPSNIRDII